MISHVGILELEAPAVDGFAFLGRTGWLGVRCSCGFIVSARSMSALDQALNGHQEPATCPAMAAIQAPALEGGVAE